MKTLFFISRVSLVFGFLAVSIFHQSHRLLAQDEFERVEVLDNPRYSLNNRLVLDVDFTYYPVDAFYKPVTIDVGLSYQLHDFFSWEAVRFGYSLTNYDTKLNNTIATVATNYANEQLDEAGSTREAPLLEGTTSEELKSFNYRVSSTGFFNLLYSKSNFFNTRTVYHYWQAGLGASYYDLGREDQYSLDAVLRARFFLSQHFMFNIRGGLSFGFNSKAPQQMTFLSAGGAYAF